MKLFGREPDPRVAELMQAVGMTRQVEAFELFRAIVGPLCDEETFTRVCEALLLWSFAGDADRDTLYEHLAAGNPDAIELLAIWQRRAHEAQQAQAVVQSASVETIEAAETKGPVPTGGPTGWH